jgi:hypothetical protein
MMRKPTFNLIVDATALVILAGLIATGFLLEYKLPPGSGGGEGRGLAAIHGSALAVWGMTRHQWGDVHLILAFVLAGLMAIHLVSHWQWIRAMAKTEGGPSGGMRKGVILGAAAVSLVLVLLPFLLTPCRLGPGPAAPVPPGSASQERAASPASAGGNVQEGGGSELIYGALTLDEVAQRTGLSVLQVITILGVKSAPRGDEKLGRLLRSEGLNMQDARRKLLQAMPAKPGGTSSAQKED